MFDQPFELLAACCAVCSTYTLLLEHAKRQAPLGADHGSANLALAAVQSLWNVVYGTCRHETTWKDAKVCLKASILYTLNIWFPVAGQYMGIDSLTLLLLRASSPVLTSWLQPRLLNPRQKVGIILATIATLLAGVGASYQHSGSAWSGIVFCMGGTLAACMLSVEQSRLAKGNLVTRDVQFTQMHLMCCWTFLPASFVIGNWLIRAPVWLTLSTTILQWLCSISIAVVNHRRDAVIGQMTLTVRRAICSILVAALYKETATTWHWASLACALLSSVVYQ